MDFVLVMTLTLMILTDEQVHKMKAERVLQLQSRLDAASQTEEEKTEFRRLHYKCVLEQGLHDEAVKRMHLCTTVLCSSIQFGDDDNKS